MTPVSQENLSPGNCVAATVFPQEIMLLTINVANVYPKEILSSGNTVARHGSVRIRPTLLLAFCCNQTYILLLNETLSISIHKWLYSAKRAAAIDWPKLTPCRLCILDRFIYTVPYSHQRRKTHAGFIDLCACSYK